MKFNFKPIIAVLLIAVIAIGGAASFLASESKEHQNSFKVGTLDVQLIEEFNGETLIGGNSQTTSVPCVPGTTIDKKAYVEFTGTGQACAYIRVDIPIAETDQIVDENGVLTGETANAVTLNLDDVGLGRLNNWYYLNSSFDGTRHEDQGIVSYYYYYRGILTEENPRTDTSPIDSISIANMLVRNDSEGVSYDVTVTAYALQCTSLDANPAEVWKASGNTF